MNAVFPPWPIREFRDWSDGIPESGREDSIFRGAGAFFFGRTAYTRDQKRRFLKIGRSLTCGHMALILANPQPLMRHQRTLESKRNTPHEIVWKAFEYYSSLKKVDGYCREHPTESLTLAAAATIAGLERTYFSKFFRQKTGVNFKY